MPLLKPLTAAEERLLRVGLPSEQWGKVMRYAANVEHEFETCGFGIILITGRYRPFQTRSSIFFCFKFWNNLVFDNCIAPIWPLACSASKSSLSRQRWHDQVCS